jgi:light-regulated signal transduction histidine kinase (bacteriophytochrome)
MTMAQDNIRVLLIDDNDADREAVFRQIYNVFCVLEAKTGREGLDTAKQSKPACVLLDYRLPDFDGLDLLKRFVDAQIPVVMLTGQGNEELAARAIKLGAEDYLSKSLLTKETLTRAVANAIEKFNLRRQLEDQQQDVAGFVAFVSEEMKSPLRDISRAAESMQQQAPSSNQQIDLINQSVSQLDALIDAMVEYMHVGWLSDELGIVDLEQCLERTSAALQGEVDASGAAIHWDRMPVVRGRATALSEVFQHLVRMAIQDAVEYPPQIRISSELNEDVWTIVVAGNGIAEGSAKSVDKPVGGPHEKSHSAGGLGLVACAKIIKQHGGRIWADFQESGTTFRFTLPKT